ncbi:MAG: L-fucose/L-arabinose isomerase family protein [Sphingomonadales bacterium]
MALVYGVAALARPTFDVPFAEEKMNKAFAALDAAGIKTVGPRALLFDAEAAKAALDDIKAAGPIDVLLVLQITFTDATMTVRLADEVDVPLAIWAVPEPRIGGRLRLNALCGLNLAVHALQKAGKLANWLYADPGKPGLANELRALAKPPVLAPSRATVLAGDPDNDAARVLDALQGIKINVLGHHPDGFDTCAYDDAVLAKLGGVTVERTGLDEVFNRARAAAPARVAGHHQTAADALGGLEDVDQQQLDRSLRVFCALEDVAAEKGAKGLAVRCWPEMFTEYGCAACGPMAMMNEARVPAACEADVHGAYTQLMLQELAQAPAWMTDLVDIDVDDDTAVLWHCGSAPLSMRDPESPAEATIHTNRKMPLLHQFRIKPGRITLARLSQARGELKMMLAGAEVVRAPMAFTGTSGTVTFDAPARDVCRTIMDEGLEHHFALVYGEHRPALRAIAARLGLPVLELT